MAHSTDDRPEFSIIITSYFEEATLDEFYTRLSQAAQSLERSYEFIFINDGSTDGTYDLIRRFYDSDPHVHAIIDLFQNSGQLAAMTAGMTVARGSAFVFIDSDLQLDPEELPFLVAEYDKGFDLVTGYRKERHDAWSRIVPSKIANMIMRRVSRSNLRDFGCTFKIWNAKLLRAIEYGPHKLFNTAIAISKTGSYKEIPVTHHARKAGKSGWTFRKLWQFNMDNVVNLTEKPFQLLAGLCVLGAIIFTGRLLIELFIPLQVLPEVTTGLLLNVLVIVFLILAGILAILGEFTIRIFKRTQRDPAYIIRELHTRDDTSR